MRFKLLGLGLTLLALDAGAPASAIAAKTSDSGARCAVPGYRLAGNQRRGFICLRKHHGPKAPVCRRGLHAQHLRKGAARIRCVRVAPHPVTPLPPVAPTPPPSSSLPPPPVSNTPLTVANICYLDSGLGELHFHEHLVYWDNNHDGQVDFGAADLEGESEVDVAFIYSGPNVGGHLVWFAVCPPHESKWINVPLYEREQELHPLPPVSVEGGSAFLNLIANEGNIAAVWASPDLAVGTVVGNTGGKCGPVASQCIVESSYW